MNYNDIILLKKQLQSFTDHLHANQYFIRKLKREYLWEHFFCAFGSAGECFPVPTS